MFSGLPSGCCPSVKIVYITQRDISVLSEEISMQIDTLFIT